MQFDFSPATSFVLQCDTQAEIDHCWDKLIAAGEANMGGWLVDKFGISWQVIPSQLSQFLSNPATSKAVIERMLQMKKIEITALEEAAVA